MPPLRHGFKARHVFFLRRAGWCLEEGVKEESNVIREILAASGEVGTGKTHTLCVSKNIVMKSHSVLSGVLKRIREIKVLFLLLLAANSLYAADYTLSYRESSNVMSSTGLRADVSSISPLSYSGTVTIPSSYKRASYNESFIVMGISSGAFSGSALTKLYVPDSVIKIDYLGSCPSLKKIVLRAKNYKYTYNGTEYFDKSAFTGTHPDCIIYVPRGFYMKDDGVIFLDPGDLLGGRPIEWFHYHVKFNANGGSGTMPEQTIYTDATTNLIANTFTRNGYTFSGWATSASGAKKYSDKASVKNLDTGINATVNLYAVWTANNYTVKFNANGGSGTMATQSFVYGEAKNLTANAFTRAGYTFFGWATSASGAKVYSDKQSVKNLTSSSNGSVNLYAVWESALSVSVLSAKQRYPWNGLVDVKCVLDGGANQNYNVAFVVNDEVGGTNIPARTFWQIGGNTTNNVLTVKPGNLHFVWDANADIAEDGEFPAVSITVNVEPAVDVMEVKVLNNAN